MVANTMMSRQRLSQWHSIVHFIKICNVIQVWKRDQGKFELFCLSSAYAAHFPIMHFTFENLQPYHIMNMSLCVTRYLLMEHTIPSAYTDKTKEIWIIKQGLNSFKSPLACHIFISYTTQGKTEFKRAGYIQRSYTGMYCFMSMKYFQINKTLELLSSSYKWTDQ